MTKYQTRMPALSRFLHLFCPASALFVFFSPALPAAPPETLADALKRSTFVVRRTPLLIVDAEGTARQHKTIELRYKFEDLYKSDDAKPALPEILDAYNRQLVSCSSVQVIAPRTRVEIKSDLGSAETFLVAEPEQAAKRLLLSLKPAQWMMATSAQGIGLGDLDKPEQKALFRSLIQEPFTLQQVVSDTLWIRKIVGSQEFPTESLRVRLVRNAKLELKGLSGAIASTRSFNFPIHTVGDRSWMRDNVNKTLSRRFKTLPQEVANKLRSSDLGFNTAPLYGKQVSLSGVKNVGDLVQRIAEQTGLELYVDRRVSGWSITVVGQEEATGDAADLMKALCYALGGAIRGVRDETGNRVYLLTGDRSGLAASWLQTAEWDGEGVALTQENQQLFRTMLREENRIKQITLGSNSQAIADRTMERIDAALASASTREEGSRALMVPIRELPSEAQEQMRADFARADADGQQNYDRENVQAVIDIGVDLILPEYGVFEGPELGNLIDIFTPIEKESAAPPVAPPPTGPITLPPTVARSAVLKLTPQSGDDQDKVLRFAKRHGFRALFIKTSLWDDADWERVAVAAQAGKAQGLPVYVAVSLFKVPVTASEKSKAATTNLPQIRNILGETLQQYAKRRKEAFAVRAEPDQTKAVARLENVEWLDVADESVRKAVTERLRRVAAIPDIAGLVLEDTGVPGYAVNNSYIPAAFAGQYGSSEEALRATFIREANLDPLDMPLTINDIRRVDLPENTPFPVGHNFPQRLNPFVYRRGADDNRWTATAPSSTDPVIVQWQKLREQKNLEWVGEVRRNAGIPAPVTVYWEFPPTPDHPTPFGTKRWDAADARPPYLNFTNILLPAVLGPSVTAETTRTLLGVRLPSYVRYYGEKVFDGVVIDITALKLNTALSYLECLETAKEK